MCYRLRFLGGTIWEISDYTTRGMEAETAVEAWQTTVNALIDD